MTTRNILTFFCLALLLAMQACSEGSASNESTAGPAKQVTTAAVRAVQYEERVRATGKLGLEEQARLSFKTGGIIQRILVEEGESVRRGQLLAELDLDEINAQATQADIGIQQAEIQVENAELALRLAERDYRNAKGLYQDSVATLEQLQDAEVQLDNARNQLEAAKKELKVRQEQSGIAHFNLQHSRIIAPANGTILRRMAEPNELASPGRPILLFGSREKAWVVRVAIPDKDIIFVDIGDAARINFDAYPDKTFEGRVRTLASMADPVTNTYQVEVEVLHPRQRLVSGFIGRVEIETGSKKALLQIPIDALLVADKRQGSVFTLEKGIARRHDVGIYRMEGEYLLLRSGLDTTQRVITSGVGYLQEGDSIELKPPK